MSYIENQDKLDCHSSEARVEKMADCTKPKKLRVRSHMASRIYKS
jgi:hypothetical protein